MGTGIDMHRKGRHIAFSGGTGVLVFIDMVAHLILRLLPSIGGPDIITDGVEGFIIPIRDVEALKHKLEWCYSHPHELAEMGRAARRKAEELNWGLYRQRLANKVQSLLNAHRI